MSPVQAQIGTDVDRGTGQDAAKKNNRNLHTPAEKKSFGVEIGQTGRKVSMKNRRGGSWLCPMPCQSQKMKQVRVVDQTESNHSCSFVGLEKPGPPQFRNKRVKFLGERHIKA